MPDQRVRVPLRARSSGPSALLDLQRTAGNAAVVQLLGGGRPVVQRCGPVPCDCTPEEQAQNARAPLQRTIGDGHDLCPPRFAGDLDLEACYDDEARLTMNGIGQPGKTQVERGASVRKVQDALFDLGFLASVAVTGIYNQATWNAVKELKRTKHLGFETLGDVGPGTMDFLNKHFTPPCPRTLPSPPCPPCSGGPTPPTPPTPAACTAPPNPDMSGRAFNPTTDSQAWVAAGHPIDALTADSLADDALAAARSSGLPGLYLGPADAFRHALWNCQMAKRLGATRAEQFATAHENDGPSPIAFDNQMDLHNNAMGRSLAGAGDCEAAVRAALAAGQLRTIRGPATTPHAVPPVPTACFGASNQPWP
jgi:peptidoglycan hydrolase-like protein with peptidoglycan-binding domain